MIAISKLKPKEWLRLTKKYPYVSTDIFNFKDKRNHPFWYWATEISYNGPCSAEELEESKDFILPLPIWNNLKAKTTYPFVKSYWTEKEALQDFSQAFKKAVKYGWKP